VPPSAVAFSVASELRKAVAKAIGEDPAAYTLTKIQTVQTVGFGDNPLRVRFTFAAADKPALYDALADFAIGATDRLPVDTYEARKPVWHRTHIRT